MEDDKFDLVKNEEKKRRKLVGLKFQLQESLFINLKKCG